MSAGLMAATIAVFEFPPTSIKIQQLTIILAANQLFI